MDRTFAGAHGDAAAEARADRIRSRRVRLIVTLASLSAFGPLTTDMYLPSLPQVARGFGIGASQAQLTLTACLTGLAVGQMIAGPLSDTLGRRRPLLVCLALFVVASAGCALTTSVWELDVARAVQGLTGAGGIVLARAIVRDLYSGNAAARYFSVLAAVQGVAPIAAPLIGGQLLRVAPWRGLFLVLAAIGVLMLVAVTVWIPESAAVRAGGSALRTTGRALSALVRDRAFVGYALTGGFAMGALFAYISASSFVYEDLFTVSPQVYSLLFGLNSVGIMAASSLNGWLLGRVGVRRMLTIGVVCVAAGGIAVLVVAVLGLGLPAIMPGMFVAVSSIGLIMPNTTALALSDHGSTAGTASALLGLVQFAFGGLMAPIVGIGGVSAVPMAVAMAVLGAASAATWLAVRRVGAPVTR
jgi:DHA1 family bicyclomycin/chloramphenicol resistance-like MFS transporter